MAKQQKKKKKKRIKNKKQRSASTVKDIVKEEENDVKTGSSKNTLSKTFVTKSDILNSPSYKQKIEKIRKRIIHQKSFAILMNFNSMIATFRHMYIDNNTDEIDIILNEIVTSFKRRLSKIHISMVEYQQIEAFFENIKTAYREYVKNENKMTDSVQLKINTLLQLDKFIVKKLF